MLTLAPLTFAVFGGVSLVGFGVNLLAIPLISFVFVPLVLAGRCWPGGFPALDGLPFGARRRCTNGSGRAWSGRRIWSPRAGASTPSAWWFMLAVPAALASLWRWPLALRLSGAAMLLPLVFMPSRLPESGAVRVERARRRARLGGVDRNARARAVVRHRRQLELPRHEPGTRRYCRRWMRSGIRRVDLLVLPRLDPDRAAGAALLAAERGVERILVGGGWPGNCAAGGGLSRRAIRVGRSRPRSLRRGPARELLRAASVDGFACAAVARRPGRRGRAGIAGAPARPARWPARWCS